MKIINFIISLLSSLWLFAVGLLLFLAGFVASFLGAMFFDAPTAKQDLIIEDFRMFLVAIILVIVALITLVFCIVGFVKRKKLTAYTVLNGINCGFNLIGYGLSIPLCFWVYNEPIDNSQLIFIWPIAGFAVTVVMIILTAINVVKEKASH